MFSEVLLSQQRIFMKMKKFLNIALLIPGLMVLPACDWFGSKESAPSAQDYSMGGSVGSQEIAVTIDGKPGVTVEEFQRNLDAIKQAQPMMEQMLPFMPEDQQRMMYAQIAENIIGGTLIQDYVAAQGWDKNVEYLQNARRLHEDLDKELANREFQSRLLKEISVTDAELKSYYENNRETNMIFKRAPFMIAADGVTALVVKAQDEAQAKAIVDAAKKSGDLKQAAQAHKQKVEDLGLVTAQTMEPDRLVIIKALGMQNFPSVEMVKSGDAYWVIQATGKKNAEFALFDQVKDAVNQVVLSDRFQKAYMNKINDLKKNRDVVVNQGFIDSLIVKAPATAQAAMPTEAMLEETDK